MKREIIVLTVLGLAAAPQMLASSPASADGLGLFNRGKAVAHNSQARSARKRPRVRGFVFRPGGFSYTVQQSYSFDYDPAPPSDFGPHLDYAPSSTGIIPTDLYR